MKTATPRLTPPRWGSARARAYNILEGRRVISEDGSTVVFQSDDALTPHVHGGTSNVYLWRGGDVYLISDGTPAGKKIRMRWRRG